MEHCPVCNAAIKNKPLCRRCRSDLQPLIAVETAAAEHLVQAEAAYQTANYTAMHRHAGRACSLRQTPLGIRTLARAALLNRQFDRALSLWTAWKTTTAPQNREDRP